MNIAYKLMLTELIEGCVAGNRNSQRKLYEFFYGKMMAVCMRYAGSREEAAEVLNTGFLKVYKNIQKFNPEEGVLEAWMRRIMINTAIDHYRKEMRREKTVELQPSWQGGYEAPILAQISAEEIMSVVQELSPAYRTVFNLYVVEGMNHREIAEQLGISEGTSKSNLAKARRNLQEKLSSLKKINLEKYARENI